MEIKRGDIFYIQKGNVTTGSEQYPDRPAVIVSNDKCNEHSPCVEIVYMTTQEKNPMPTHVEVMCHVPSIALCEGVQTISKDRVGNYIRSCTDKEMDAIDEALVVSLGIDSEKNLTARNAIASFEIRALKSLNAKLEKENDRLRESKSNGESEEIIALQTKCELYKQQYETLLEKVLGK
jgi:mRNA interferase MazF